jgi:Holliday junction resolvase RusA-like endonuclease
MNITTIHVCGDPAAQGSKRLVSTKSGRTVMLENSRKVKPWRTAIAEAARSFRCPMIEGDVAMRVRVRFVRPSSHFRKDGSVKPSAPVRPGRADCDKLLRAVCDALTGIAYHDDRQVCAISAERVWCDHGQESGATIDISPCPTNGKWLYQHS